MVVILTPIVLMVVGIPGTSILETSFTFAPVARWYFAFAPSDLPSIAAAVAAVPSSRSSPSRSRRWLRRWRGRRRQKASDAMAMASRDMMANEKLRGFFESFSQYVFVAMEKKMVKIDQSCTMVKECSTFITSIQGFFCATCLTCLSLKWFFEIKSPDFLGGVSNAILDRFGNDLKIRTWTFSRISRCLNFELLNFHFLQEKNAATQKCLFFTLEINWHTLRLRFCGSTHRTLSPWWILFFQA